LRCYRFFDPLPPPDFFWGAVVPVFLEVERSLKCLEVCSVGEGLTGRGLPWPSVGLLLESANVHSTSAAAHRQTSAAKKTKANRRPRQSQVSLTSFFP